MSSLGEVGLTAGPQHVKAALLSAASHDFSQEFSDVTLVFKDVSLDYYRALLYVLSPWWKDLLLQVSIYLCYFSLSVC